MDNLIEQLNRVVTNLLNTKYPNVYKVRDLCYNGSREDLISLVGDIVKDYDHTTIRSIGVSNTSVGMHFAIPEIGSWNILSSGKQSPYLYWGEYNEYTSIQEMKDELEKIISESSYK